MRDRSASASHQTGLLLIGFESTQTRIRESRLRPFRSGSLRRHPERVYHAGGLHARKGLLCNAVSLCASKRQAGQTKPLTKLLTNTTAVPIDQTAMDREEPREPAGCRSVGTSQHPSIDATAKSTIQAPGCCGE